MTFYSMLFALVFLASVQDLFRALFIQQLIDVLFPAVVSVLVFIDTIYTSEYVENKKLRYSVPMKLLDLLGVLLLILALMVLSGENSFVKLTENNVRDFGLPAHALFWGSLTVYFALTLVWHKMARMQLTAPSYVLVVLMPVACLLSFFKNEWLDAAVAGAVLLLLSWYLVQESAGVKEAKKA